MSVCVCVVLIHCMLNSAHCHYKATSLRISHSGENKSNDCVLICDADVGLQSVAAMHVNKSYEYIFFLLHSKCENYMSAFETPAFS